GARESVAPLQIAPPAEESKRCPAAPSVLRAVRSFRLLAPRDRPFPCLRGRSLQRACSVQSDVLSGWLQKLTQRNPPAYFQPQKSRLLRHRIGAALPLPLAQPHPAPAPAETRSARLEERASPTPPTLEPLPITLRSSRYIQRGVDSIEIN